MEKVVPTELDVKGIMKFYWNHFKKKKKLFCFLISGYRALKLLQNKLSIIELYGMSVFQAPLWESWVFEEIEKSLIWDKAIA